MTTNPTPWLVLAAIVVASLAWKGYIKLPRTWPGSPGQAAPRPGDPGGLTAQELGILMALAARREAETQVAREIAQEATDRLKATFVAPFSPAGPEPKAGG